MLLSPKMRSSLLLSSIKHVIISGTEHNRKLKFSMQTLLTHVNTITEYCHASVNLDYVDVLYLQDWDVYIYRPFLRNQTTTTFCLKKHCVVIVVLMSVCMSVCVSVCVCVCVSVSVYTITKNNGSINLKLKHVVVYKNSSNDFDIGHCTIKVKVTA